MSTSSKRQAEVKKLVREMVTSYKLQAVSTSVEQLQAEVKKLAGAMLCWQCTFCFFAPMLLVLLIGFSNRQEGEENMTHGDPYVPSRSGSSARLLLVLVWLLLPVIVPACGYYGANQGSSCLLCCFSIGSGLGLTETVHIIRDYYDISNFLGCLLLLPLVIIQGKAIRSSNQLRDALALQGSLRQPFLQQPVQVGQYAPQPQQQVGVVVPASQTMQVQVPEGMSAGSTLHVQTPDGQTLQVTAPPGVRVTGPACASVLPTEHSASNEHGRVRPSFLPTEHSGSNEHGRVRPSFLPTEHIGSNEHEKVRPSFLPTEHSGSNEHGSILQETDVV